VTERKHYNHLNYVWPEITLGRTCIIEMEIFDISFPVRDQRMQSRIYRTQA